MPVRSLMTKRIEMGRHRPHHKLARLQPRRIVPPFFEIFFCSSSSAMTGWVSADRTRLSEPPCSFSTCPRTRSCDLHSQAKSSKDLLSASILRGKNFASIPRSPNPPGTRNAAQTLEHLFRPDFSISSASIFSISTPQSFAMPP